MNPETMILGPSLDPRSVAAPRAVRKAEAAFALPAVGVLEHLVSGPQYQLPLVRWVEGAPGQLLGMFHATFPNPSERFMLRREPGHPSRRRELRWELYAASGIAPPALVRRYRTKREAKLDAEVLSQLAEAIQEIADSPELWSCRARWPDGRPLVTACCKELEIEVLMQHDLEAPRVHTWSAGPHRFSGTFPTVRSALSHFELAGRGYG